MFDDVLKFEILDEPLAKHLWGQHDQSTHGHAHVASFQNKDFIDKLSKPANSLTEQEIIAVADYTQGGFLVCSNAYFRKDMTQTEQLDILGITSKNFDSLEIKNYVENIAKPLDDAIAKFSLPDDVEVYRGMTWEAYADIQVGSKLLDKGFMSTSLDQTVSQNFAQGGESNYLLRIQAPKGAKALYVDSTSSNLGQQELIFARNTNMVVTKIIEKNGVTFVDVKIEK